jgi:outer membrane autotransporter protein
MPTRHFRVLHNSYIARILTALLAIIAGLASLAPQAHALSTRCNAVNSGIYNATNISNPLFVSTNAYDPGEMITVTAYGNGTGGTVVVQINGATVQTISLTPSPQTVVQTMTSVTEIFKIAFTAGGTTTAVTTIATCAAAPAPSGSVAPLTLARGFVLSRINGMLLNSPGAMSLLNRSNGTASAVVAGPANGAAAFAGAMGLGAPLAGAMGRGASLVDAADRDALGSKSVKFSHSLSQLRRDAAKARMQQDRMALGAGEGGALPLVYETASPWDIWVEGRYSGFDDDTGNLDRDGHVGLVYVGGDYRVTEDLIVGAMLQLDWSKDETGALDTTIDGNGWMIGPYLSARVHENLYLDLRAAWGRSSNDMVLGTTTGGFDTSRWLVKGTLAGNWMHEAWRFTPSAELAYVFESQDAFTDSAGAFVPGQDIRLGRLQFGPEIGHRLAHTADTIIEPFAAIKGVWDFDNPDVAIIDGFVVGPGDFWGRLEGGLNVITGEGVVVRGLASWDGVGASDYSGYTLQGIVNVPLN